MQLSRSLPAVVIFFGLTGSVCMPAIRGGDPELADIKLPPGFSITVFAEEIANARAMCWGAKGTLFVGSRDEGVVHALKDTTGDGRSDVHYIVAKGLKLPVGVAFRDGDLYVSAVGSILKLEAIEEHLSDPPAPTTVTDDFPDKEHHGWKFIAFGPDGKLYITIGDGLSVFDAQDFTGALMTLAPLKTPVDAFFDGVMVMADDPKLRENRLALLSDLQRLMNRVADISRLAT